MKQSNNCRKSKSYTKVVSHFVADTSPTDLRYAPYFKTSTALMPRLEKVENCNMSQHKSKPLTSISIGNTSSKAIGNNKILKSSKRFKSNAHHNRHNMLFSDDSDQESPQKPDVTKHRKRRFNERTSLDQRDRKRRKLGQEKQYCTKRKSITSQTIKKPMPYKRRKSLWHNSQNDNKENANNRIKSNLHLKCTNHPVPCVQSKIRVTNQESMLHQEVSDLINEIVASEDETSEHNEHAPLKRRRRRKKTLESKPNEEQKPKKELDSVPTKKEKVTKLEIGEEKKDEFVDGERIGKKKKDLGNINGISVHEYAPTNICRRTRNSRRIRQRHSKQIRREYDSLHKESVIKNGLKIDVVCLD